MSVFEQASAGDRLATLEALRDTLSLRIDESDSARDVAALAGQLTQVLKQVEELSKAQGAQGSKVDELAERRRQRTKPIRDGRAREA